MNTQPNITVLLIDDEPQHNNAVKSLLSLEPDLKFIGAETSGKDGIAAAKRLEPNIVLLDINMPGMNGFEAAQQIIDNVPRCAVIMMTVQDSTEYMREAMAIGARNYLVKPVNPDVLYDTIRKVHARKISETSPLTPVPPVKRGKIIVVYGPQGGVGCTTAAINLATNLMQDSTRVLLIDADLQYGDVNTMLNLPGEITLMDLLPLADEEIDEEYFENFTVTHDCGLRVLRGNKNLIDLLTIEDDFSKATQIIKQLTSIYDLIVVDTSSCLDTMLLSLFDIADKIILVGTPVIETIKNMRLFFDFLDNANYDREKIVPILNRVPEDKQLKKLTISTKKIEEYFKQAISVHLPEDIPLVRKSINRCIPLVVYDHKHKRSLTKEMGNLSNLLYQDLMQ